MVVGEAVCWLLAATYLVVRNVVPSPEKSAKNAAAASFCGSAGTSTKSSLKRQAGGRERGRMCACVRACVRGREGKGRAKAKHTVGAVSSG